MHGVSKPLKTRNMKRITILLFLGIIFLNAFSQNDNLQYKLDSIINEADLLYSYERAVWNATDLFMTNSKLKNNYGGYVVAHSNDTIFATFIDKSQKQKIAKYFFINSNLSSPFNTEIGLSPLSNAEQELLDIKIKIINQLSKKKYEIGIPQNFNPNFVLIKEKEGFKLYILMGTSESDVIPFGNDYLFWADSKGTITNWKKFHSRMIPTQSKGPNGEKVVSVIHSHLKTTPFITATDICTFRLYGGLCDMDEFMVLCTATDKYYKYSIKTNKIEITEP
jgi:hypothetical protein